MGRTVVRFFGLNIVKIHCDVCDNLLEASQSGTWDYMCWTCANFDLCEKCYKNKKNRHGHEFHKQLVTGKHPKTGKTVCQILCESFDLYATRPVLGWRMKKKDLSWDNKFTWITYHELKMMADTFARGLLEIGLKKNDIVGVSGINRLEWFVADLATIFSKAVTVPIHTTYDEKVVEFILGQTELKIVVCSVDLIEKFAVAEDTCPKWDILVCMDNVKQKDLPVPLKRIKYYTMNDIMKLGKKSKLNPHEVPDQDVDDMFTINYTSGSTGMPKGVMHSNKAFLAGLTRFPDTMAVTFSYEPMAHSTRQNDIQFFTNGGRIGLISELKNLFEDCQMVNPSTMAGVPRVWNKLYSEFNEALSAATQGQPKEQHRAIERKVLREFGKLLGNRIEVISVGGAPPSKAVMNFLRRCFRCFVVDGYGITEVGSVTADSTVDNDAELKLVDWMEYKTTDSPSRGEIVVKSRQMAAGYFKNEKATSESFKDGWFHTGDIGEMTKTGLKIIGRKKQIFKLAQGEYVSPERLENIFQKSEFIDQIFIHGDSYQTYLVAVIVINTGIVIHWAKGKGIDTSNLDKLCTSNELFEQIMFEIVKYSTVEKLLPYEIPRNYHLTTEKFTIENKRMTSSEKICRPQLEADYKLLLQDLYKTADGATEDKLVLNEANMKRLMNNFTQETVDKVLTDALNLPKGADKKSFVQLGGDSLSAVKFVNLLNNTLSIRMQPEDVFKNDNIEDFAKLVKDRWEQNFKDQPATSAESKPKDNTNTKNTNVDIGNNTNVKTEETNGTDPSEPTDLFHKLPFMNTNSETFDPDLIKLDDTIQFASAETRVTTPKNAFLTGVTGILGVFILSELMEQTDFTIYCLVRDLTSLGKTNPTFDDDKAKKRIKSAMKRAGLWRHRYGKRLVPIAGDLSLPLLGLTKERFETLSNDIDVIYHNGAAVNSIQTYEYHRAPNVLGTHEVIRLAVTNKIKPLHHVSTLSVFENIGVGKWFRENTNIRTVNCPESGYGRSKYEAELICELAREKGLPIAMYRPGSVSGHSQSGYLKETDFINRMLIGIINMAAYPEPLSSSHIEFTAVDYVTKAMIYLSLQPTSIGQAFHLTSPPIVYKNIFAAIRSYGYFLEEVQLTEVWAADLYEMPENLLFPYLDMFTRNVVPYAKEVNDFQTKQALKGSNITCPPANDALFHTYLKFMQQAKLIPLPDSTNASPMHNRELPKGQKIKVTVLGENKSVSVSEFKDQVFVNIREHNNDNESGEQKPGKKGIALSEEQLRVLKSIVAKADGTLE